MTGYQRKCVALLERIAVALEVSAAAAAASSRVYSMKPSAVKMRCKRARDRASSGGSHPVTYVTTHTPRFEGNRRSHPVTNVTSAALSSSSLRSEDPEKLGGAPRVPGIFLRQVYCWFAEHHRACTGRTWYAFGKVPPQEIRNAMRFHHLVAGDAKRARAAIARFARLWRDDEFTRRLGFTFRTLCWTSGKIREGRKGLHVVAPPPTSPARSPRRRAEPVEISARAASAPARLIEMPATPKGSANVRELLKQLAAHGAPLKH